MEQFFVNAVHTAVTATLYLCTCYLVGDQTILWFFHSFSGTLAAINFGLLLIFFLLFLVAATGAILSFGGPKGVPIVCCAGLTSVFMVVFYIHVKRKLVKRWRQEMHESREAKEDERALDLLSSMITVDSASSSTERS